MGVSILTGQPTLNLTDGLPLETQLSKLHSAAAPLTGEFLGIGTPKKMFRSD
jgi:hypothetical protein